MFGNKISVLVLVGITLTLGACNQSNTSTESPSPAANETPQLSSPRQANQTTLDNKNSDRAKYQSIQLEKISASGSLKGDDPKEIVLKAFGDTQLEGGKQDVTVDYPQPEQAVVTLTQIGVADASIAGLRYRVELSQPDKSAQTNKQWQIVWAGSQVKCRPERGHQDWSTQNCQ